VSEMRTVRTTTTRINTNAASSTQPWAALPKELSLLFRPHAETVAADILQEIQRSIPEYARPLEGPFGKAITDGIGQAIGQFIERLADPNAPQENRAKLFRYLGMLEVIEGRSVDTLQMAYRVGARVAWRRLAEFGQAVNLPVATICLLAEAIFAYIDELSALSVEGYAAARARAAGALERRRRRLLELVLSQPPVAPKTLAGVAAAANWDLPERVLVVALERRGDQFESPSPAFDEGVLVDLEGSKPCLLASTEGQLANLARELSGWRAAVGPCVRLSEAATSLRWARRALGLMQRGVIQDSPVIWCDEHLSSLWLLNDEFLVKRLAERSLAPLAQLTVKQRARLSETLLAWLETRGSAPEIATRLSVHPQTVRYRLHQLDKLFGSNLNNPDDRFNMEIALRAQRLLRENSAKPSQN
jgi:hypothetical protein